MTAPVCRLGDVSSHGGAIVTASPNTLANSLGVARTGDLLDCPIHGPSPLIGTSPVLVNGALSVKVGDTAACGAVMIAGSPTVFVG